MDCNVAEWWPRCSHAHHLCEWCDIETGRFWTVWAGGGIWMSSTSRANTPIPQSSQPYRTHKYLGKISKQICNNLVWRHFWHYSCLGESSSPCPKLNPDKLCHHKGRHKKNCLFFRSFSERRGWGVSPNPKFPYQKNWDFVGFFLAKGGGSHLFQNGFIIKYWFFSSNTEFFFDKIYMTPLFGKNRPKYPFFYDNTLLE